MYADYQDQEDEVAQSSRKQKRKKKPKPAVIPDNDSSHGSSYHLNEINNPKKRVK